MTGKEMNRPPKNADLKVGEERLRQAGIDEATAGLPLEGMRQRQHQEGEDPLRQGVADDDGDQQCADGVNQSLPQLDQVIEEGCLFLILLAVRILHAALPSRFVSL